MGIAGGLTEPIIERNSPVPIDHTRVFTTVKDHQQAIAVRIYQGESRQAEGNTLLGEFEFSGFAPGPRGEVKIEVTFSISTEGIVKVQARDPKTGAERRPRCCPAPSRTRSASPRPRASTSRRCRRARSARKRRTTTPGAGCRG